MNPTPDSRITQASDRLTDAVFDFLHVCKTNGKTVERIVIRVTAQGEAVIKVQYRKKAKAD